MFTISMMVRTPRPSSPTSQASASSYSTSADALDLLPSLSFSRCRCIPFLVPSGRTLGSRKQDSPPGAWASTMNKSPIGAEVNHLCPVSRYSPGPAGTARVVFARTSEPPCFSVIDMPASRPRLVSGGRRPKSYSGAASSGSKRLARPGACRNAGTMA